MTVTPATMPPTTPKRSTHPPNKTMQPAEWALLILLSLLWGGSFFLGKVALESYRPLTLVLGRVALAALILHLVVLLSGGRMPRSVRLWRQFAVMGLLNNVIPFGLIFWGMTHISSGLAAILNTTPPLFTVLLAHWVTRDENLTPSRLGGTMIGMGGVALMIGPDALAGMGSGVLGQLAIVGAGFSYACAGICVRNYQSVKPTVTAAGQLTASTVMILPLALLVDQPWLGPLPGLLPTAALIALALVSTAVAYIIYFRILARAGATNVLLVVLLVPVSALLLGMILLGEQIAPRHFLAMAIIGLGLAAIDGRLTAALRRGPAIASEPTPATTAGSTSE